MVSMKSDDKKGRGSLAPRKGPKMHVRDLDKSALTTSGPESFSPSEIRALRDEYQISQAVLARLLGISKAAVTQWEQGLRRPTGTASKMLSLVKRKGIEILL